MTLIAIALAVAFVGTLAWALILKDERDEARRGEFLADMRLERAFLRCERLEEQLAAFTDGAIEGGKAP